MMRFETTFRNFFWPLVIEKDALLYNGSTYPADMAIRYRGSKNPIAVFEWKKYEDPKSYFEGIVSESTSH